ncbi:MAG: ATP-binding cassette domain-containing protein [Anaerolineaceae bacterium]|nr:ATP-binding cassette domain-containing protein [Anaerolineaceae bacterium]
MPDTILDVQGLETVFKTPDGIVHAVNGVSFELKEGETLGVVGESGCGKSVTMLSVLGLIPNPPGRIVAGSAKFLGQDLLKMSSDEIRAIRRRCAALRVRDHRSPDEILGYGEQGLPR